MFTYVWRDDVPVSVIVHGTTEAALYFEADHLNTPIAARNQAGTVVWTWVSEAFGSSLPNEDPDGDGTKTTINLRFPGQYFDRESGLHYNYHRYYDPAIGRYLSSDPIGLHGGINTYGYALNNPLKYSDSDGLNPGVGCLAGSWAGPVGCGVGAGLVTIIGGAILMNTVGADDPKTKEKEKTCPPEQPCDPPIGTQCWSMDVDSTSHRIIDYLGTKLGKRDTHVHIYEMQKVGTNCWWKKLGGYALDYAPSAISACVSYPSWVAQPIH